MTSHPNRAKKGGPRGPSNPTPAEIVAAREAAALTQTQASALVHSALRSWQHWESGERRMHPAFWELFLSKANGMCTSLRKRNSPPRWMNDYLCGNPTKDPRDAATFTGVDGGTHTVTSVLLPNGREINLGKLVAMDAVVEAVRKWKAFGNVMACDSIEGANALDAYLLAEEDVVAALAALDAEGGRG